MWFDDDRVAGKRLFIDVRGMSRKSAGKSNLRLGSKGDKANRATLAVLVPLLVVALAVLAWFALLKVGEALYSQNDRYKIVNLQIKGGKILTPELIAEYTRIQKGANLFSFSATKVRADFLRKAPNVKSITIIRQLPGTVKIEVVERDPVARFGGKSSLLVADREGYVFILKTGRPELPVISGYKDDLKPSAVVKGPTLAALEALDGCNDPRLVLRVESIDVGRHDCLVLSIPYDDIVREIRLAWNGMGSGTPESRQNLLKKLSWVVQTLQSSEGRKYTKLEVILDGGRVYGAP